MRSQTSPSFWKAYEKLPPAVKSQARKTYSIWQENPFHPSLRFKCINTQENIWSARVTRSYRALGVLDDDVVTWFWIGDHDAYSRYFG